MICCHCRFWISTKNWTFWHNEISINLCLYFSHKIQLYLFRKNKKQSQFIIWKWSVFNAFNSESEPCLNFKKSVWKLWLLKFKVSRYGGSDFCIFFLWFILFRISETVKERSKISSNSVFSHLITQVKKKSLSSIYCILTEFLFILFQWCYDPFLFFYGIGVMIPLSDFFIKPNKKKLVGVLLPKK